MARNSKDILVSTPNWLGDVIFSLPVFRSLKEAFPEAKVTALCVPRVKEILSLCPFIDQVIEYDEDGKDRSLFCKMSLMALLARQNFRSVYFLKSSVSRSAITALAGVPRRVGYSRNCSFFLTDRVPVDGTDHVHRSDMYLRILEAGGIKINDRRSVLTVPPSESQKAVDFLKKRGLDPVEKYAVLNSGGNWGLKQWPSQKFSELTRRISVEMGLKVVLTGAAKDVKRVEEIALRSGAGPIVAAGNTGLRDLAAIMSRAEFVVSADSGPLHVASAVGAKVVGLFGPTRAEITGPRGPGRSVVIQKDVGCNQAPCYHLECADNRCMHSVSVNDVMEAIKKLGEG